MTGDYDDYDDYDDPPLYAPGHLAGLSPEQLQKEWQRQSSIHDHGVDNLADYTFN